MSVKSTTQTVSGVLGTLAVIANGVFFFGDKRPASERGTLGFVQVIAGAVSIAALAVLAASKNPGKTKEQADKAYQQCEILEDSESVDVVTHPAEDSGVTTALLPTKDQNAFSMRTILQLSPSKKRRTITFGAFGVLSPGIVFACELFMPMAARPTILVLSGFGMLGAAACAGTKLSGDKEIETARIRIARKIEGIRVHLAPSSLKSCQIAIEEDLRRMVLSHNLKDIVAQYQMIKKIMEAHRLGTPSTKATSSEVAGQRRPSTMQPRSLQFTDDSETITNESQL